MEKLDKRNIKDILALTPMQKGMLFDYLKNPESNHYFEQLSLEISGVIDLDLFEKAWGFVIETNEMLRTVFRWDRFKSPIQITLKDHKLQPRYYDCSDIGGYTKKQKRRLEEIREKDRKEKFNLGEVPFRVTLCKLEEGTHVMIISNHHILYDGWSIGIILKEFFNAYNDLYHGKEILRPIKTRFREFVKWNQDRDSDEQVKFWRNYLKGFDTSTELTRKTRKGKVIPFPESFKTSFSRDLTGKIENFVKNHRITLAAFLYTAWGILLQKYCNREDVIFGTTVSGRSAPIKGIENMVGLFINTIPLRVKTETGEKIEDLLRKINDILLLREAHETTPLVEIKGNSELKNSKEIFNSIIVLENYPLDNRLKQRNNQSQLSINSFSIFELTNYDLTVSLAMSDEIEINFIYMRELFDKETVVRLSNHFTSILRLVGIENGIEKTIYEIDILSEAEKRELLFDFNDTKMDYPKEKPIHQLFEEQVVKTPDNIALLFKDKELSYGELNRKANQLTSILIKKGVIYGAVVLLLIERSIDLLLGILGVLKSGGIYLPADTDNPGNRLCYMIEDSHPQLVLTQSHLLAQVEFNGTVIAIDVGDIFTVKGMETNPEAAKDPKSPAYIIYTSGSTGNPKGVLVEHFSVVNLAFSQKEEFGINEKDRVLQFSTICFDASVEQIFIALFCGAGLVLIDKGILLDIGLFEAFIASRSITHLHSVPSFLNNMKLKDTYNLKRIISGGDVCSVALAKRWNKHCDFYNEYGPTETTVTSIEMLVEDVDDGLPGLSIGRSINNTFVYLFDKWLKLVPLGVVGELYIGGDGVARGYLNRPELTNEKFDHDLWDYPVYQLIKNYKLQNTNYKQITNHKLQITNKTFHQLVRTGVPSSKKLLRGVQGGGFLENSPPGRRRQRIYKTGDLACWLADGNIEFLGRIDHQVKIRGFRIEPGEIESHLLNHSKVREAVVLARTDGSGNQYLAAYFIPDWSNDLWTGKPVTELREYLLNLLPGYMVPSYFMEVDEIPLSPNGKIDRRALPEIEMRTGEAYVAPRDEIEERLVGIWSEVLTTEVSHDQSPIGVDANFFQWGGHSLKAVALSARVHKVFNVKLPLGEIFKSPTIRGLSQYIKRTRQEHYQSIVSAEEKEYYILSSTQKRLYFLQQMDKTVAAYNMSSVWVLKGEVDKVRLQQTFKELIQRHESLRTWFEMVGEEPVQRIGGRNIQFRIIKSLAEKKEQAIADIVKAFIGPFDLSQTPLLRVGLVNIGNQENLLMVDMHHIISDGISSQVLVEEFMRLYVGERLCETRLQYRDYAEWLKVGKRSSIFIKQEEYWKKEFEGEVPVLDLPTDIVRPTVQDFAGNQISFKMGRSITNGLRSLALEEGVTLYMVLLALFTILLSKLSSQEDILVGAPVAGRRHGDLKEVIGMFVNTLVLRNYPEGEKTFVEFLAEVKESTLQAFENQEYQYEELVEQVVVNRDLSRNPLFDACFLLQNLEHWELEIPGLKLIPYEYAAQTTKFDLMLEGTETSETLLFRLQYRTGLFKQETMKRFIEYYKNIVSVILKDRERKISGFEIISETEKKQVLYDFNETMADYPKDKTIQELFEECSGKSAHRIAFVGPPGTAQIQLTYKAFNTKANQLASRLRAKGINANVIVGIMVEPSLEMIIGIFGILKAGGGYLPIDPGYPGERIKYILEDSQTPLLLTQKGVEKPIETIETGCDVIDLKESVFYRGERRNPVKINRPGDLAYIIYTSGSTGNPKGVLIEHGSVVNTLVALFKKYPLSPGDTYLLKTSYMFDVSVSELFGWFWGGGCLALLGPRGEKDPQLILDTIERAQITHINFVPSMFNIFLEILNRKQIDKLTCLKYIFLAGETLLPDAVKKFRQFNLKAELENIYGPTESTIYASKYSLSRSESSSNIHIPIPIPIGKPLANMKLYILDKYGQLQPLGTVGELCISGPGLARGYLNRPELTNKKFDQDLWDYQDYHDKKRASLQEQLPGQHLTNLNKKLLRGVQGGGFLEKSPPGRRRQRIYKTGDLARWLGDGNIEFLGRMDYQVKIRGFRIELGEIESHLLNHSRIRETVVIPAEMPGSSDGVGAGEKYLCAYVAADSGLDISALRKSLSRCLPGYMIPTYFVQLEKIPLTMSGKIDRKALPEPQVKAGDDHAAPVSQMEKRLVQIWSKVLNIREEVIGIDSSFFELGGQSLKAIQVVDKIHKILNVEISIQDLFRFPKISSLANLIQKSKVTRFLEIEPQEEKEYYPLSYSQKRLWFIHKQNPGNYAFNMPAKITLYEAVDKNITKDVFMNLVVRHESLRTCFKDITKNPVQFIEPIDHLNLNLEILDLSHLEGSRREKERNRLLMEESFHIFNLEQAPLFQVKLVKCGEEEFDLIINMHHIISDGWSMEILKQEFSRLYKAYKEGIDCEMPHLPLQYKDYAVWHNQLLADEEKVAKAKEFWKNQLSGILPILDLPYDSNPGPTNIKESAAYCRVIPEELTNRLREIAFNHGASLFMVLLAGFNILLSLVTRQSDIILAIPAAARQHEGLENIFGMFVNTLIIRNKIIDLESFEDFFNRLQENTFEMLKYQGIPLEIICGQLKIKYPTISVFFNMINIGNGHQENLTSFECFHEEKVQDAKFDMVCYLKEYKNGIEIKTDYFKDRFNPITIETLLVLYKKVLEKISMEPQTRIGDYNLTREKRKLKRKTALNMRTPITTGERNF